MRVVTGVLGLLGALNGAVLRMGLWLALIALGAMVAVVIVQVWCRYVLGDALPWPDEAARFLMLWMTGLAAPWGLRHHGFVAIETLPSKLGPRAASALRLVLLSVALMVLSMALVLGWDHVQSGRLFASSSLRVPLGAVGGGSVPVKLAWMYLSLLVGVALMTSVTVELTLREVARLAGAGDALPDLAATDLPGAE